MQFGPARGAQHLLRLMALLEQWQPSGETDLSAALRAYLLTPRRAGLCFIISDLFSPAGYQAGLRELLELVFGLIPYIKTKDELLEAEFEKFDSRYMPPQKDFLTAKNFFKSYVLDAEFRLQVDAGNFAPVIASHASGEYLRKLSAELRKKIIAYVRDYVPLNQFA